MRSSCRVIRARLLVDLFMPNLSVVSLGGMLGERRSARRRRKPRSVSIQVYGCTCNCMDTNAVIEIWKWRAVDVSGFALGVASRMRTYTITAGMRIAGQRVRLSFWVHGIPHVRVRRRRPPTAAMGNTPLGVGKSGDGRSQEDSAALP